MAKLTFVLLAVVAVVVLATTEVSAKSVEVKRGPMVAIQSPKYSVGASCDCDTCSSECVEYGYVGGLCYQDECYCAYFN